MIDLHWDGMATNRKPENNVSLGFAEGLNNKIYVLHLGAYGLKDEEYLRLKVLSRMLPGLFDLLKTLMKEHCPLPERYATFGLDPTG